MDIQDGNAAERVTSANVAQCRVKLQDALQGSSVNRQLSQVEPVLLQALEAQWIPWRKSQVEERRIKATLPPPPPKAPWHVVPPPATPPPKSADSASAPPPPPGLQATQPPPTPPAIVATPTLPQPALPPAALPSSVTEPWATPESQPPPPPHPPPPESQPSQCLTLSSPFSPQFRRRFQESGAEQNIYLTPPLLPPRLQLCEGNWLIKVADADASTM